MKHKIIESVSKFTPFYLEIEVESVEDLVELYKRFSLSSDDVDEKSYTYLDFVTPPSVSEEIWRELGRILQESNIPNS